MTVSIANTEVNNTWDFARMRVNQMANVITTQAVTVYGNSAVGDADITGTLRANTLYTYTLYGGSIGNNQVLTIGSNTNFTANVNIAGNLTVQQNVVANNATVTNKITANTVWVGNTKINTANIYSDNYFGTWSGNIIDITKGGTGTSVIPSNGTILIGSGNTYVSNTISQGLGITITTAPGSITILNSGVIGFRTATNTANVYTAWRSANVTLTGGDIINALGFTPAAASTDGWLRQGTDQNYYAGNVAIGYTDGNPRSNGKLMILATDTLTNQPGLFIENQGNNATSGAYINLSVANTSSYTGIRFQYNNTADGAIEYSPGNDFLRFTTAGAAAGGFDGSKNFGVGTTSLSPNKGGNGIHVMGTNPGVTFDNGSGTQWHIGQNPNPTFLGGTRQAGQFGLFSDAANLAMTFAGTGNTATINLSTNGITRWTVDGNGKVRIGTASLAAGAVLQVGGDIVTEGNFANYSDYRLKNSITDLTEEQSLDRIQKLRPVTFRWNDFNNLEEGFIAHEVKEVVPTAVKGVKDGFEYQTLDKSQLTPTIVKAIQALINIVNEQQEEINRLKGL